ncbi:VOC family protein [Streptomyces sp. NPDC048669]|uniref:VOC family protein n=1 Tax=Streptomyces sp. NPDC048669 TaxID=3155267 RepID=UPI003416558D
MTTQLRRVTFLCTDPEALARFWSSVLHKPVIDGSHGLHLQLVDGNEPQSLYFKPAAHGERPGATMRLGVGAVCGTLEEEVLRLTALGAVRLAESQDPFDLSCVTMADPEGNEFAVEMSEEELLDEELNPRPKSEGRLAP